MRPKSLASRLTDHRVFAGIAIRGQFGIVLDGAGIADDVALDLGAPLALQEHAFALGLHALCDHRDIESLAESYHRAHDGLGLAVMIDTRDERPIDLDLVEGE